MTAQRKARATSEAAEPVATFEELYAQLDQRARKLEQGNLPLEEALQLYEEGAALVDQLRAVLESAELRVKRVQGRLQDDAMELRELEAEYEAEE